MSESFDMVVGTKRQVTIPMDLFRRLALKQGDQLRITIQGESISLEPMVSVPRHLVSESLLREIDARRGEKPDDLTLTEFLEQRRPQPWQGRAASKARGAPSPSRPPRAAAPTAEQAMTEE
ncbi:MAG: AbrB/MazE/SpoVT family DNA-binding domain-containing protein [Acidobacteriota bacterium]|nr:AbrB/MazE/SpoVT family DNA-binding domain-containing protein [Acidobacteriota bacterium]